MKKILLTAALALITHNAMADWSAYSKSDVSTGYYDVATARKSGSKVKLWILYDQTKEDSILGKPYWSTKQRTEFDCKREQWRVLSLSFYSDHMGKGKVVISSSDKNKFQPVLPGTVIEHYYKLACGPVISMLAN